MSAGETLSLMAAVSGLVAIIAILARVYTSRLAFKEKKMELLASQAVEKAARHASEKADLEARVRVLETIVTDGGYATAMQIDALRPAGPSDVN